MNIAYLVVIAAFGMAGIAVAVAALAAVSRLTQQWAQERERLLTAVMSPDALISLQRLEQTAKMSIANADSRAVHDLEERLARQEDDRRLEHIGGI